MEIDEIDGMLNEREKTFKKKIFDLSRMETLVFSDFRLENIYNSLMKEGPEKWGYHTNSMILNYIFVEYILNSKKYLQKYKNIKPIEKKRRDKSGINQLKHELEADKEKNIEKTPEEPVDEMTGAGSSGAFATNAAWSANGKPAANKPMWHGGTMLSENDNYLTDPKMFENYLNMLNENAKSEDENQYGSELNLMNKSNVDIINGDNQTHKWDSVDLKTEEYTRGVDKNVDLKHDFTPKNPKANQINKNTDAFGSQIGQWNNQDISIVHSDSVINHKWNEGKLDIVKQPEEIDGKPIEESSMLDRNETSMVNRGEPVNAQSNNMTMGTQQVTESNINEVIQNNPKVQRLVDEINALIRSAVDSVGDPIPVTDKSSTWEQPYVYLPIQYVNGKLKIQTKEDPAYRLNATSEVILPKNMEFDGIPQLLNIKKMYKSAIKKNSNDMGNQTQQVTESLISEMEEIMNEIENITIQHNKLKNMSEDRKPSSLVLRDRLGSENEKNFKKDFQHSGTKTSILDTDKLYQTEAEEVGDNPYKNGENIENEELKKTGGEALKNVGDSANLKGDEIPKRNMTDKEQETVDSYRLGLGDLVYDNPVGKRFEERMKNDMGDKLYQQRQEKLIRRAEQPMYNKDTQPVGKESNNKGNDNDSKYMKNLAEETVVGKYSDTFGKNKFINFNLESVNVVKTINEDWSELTLDGMGNSFGKIGEINESVTKAIFSHKFYINENKEVFAIKNIKKSINEDTNEKKVVNNDLEKMKRLFGYKSEEYMNTKNTKQNRGF